MKELSKMSPFRPTEFFDKNFYERIIKNVSFQTYWVLNITVKGIKLLSNDEEKPVNRKGFNKFFTKTNSDRDQQKWKNSYFSNVS